MDILKKLSNTGIVPVVVIDNAKDAVPTAQALLAGGIDVMEITFRTAAAPDAIKAVADNCPDMLVGAGTVITLEQCQKAVEMGAKFIVSPGFDAEVVKWCVDNGVAITPGCVTPSEIMAAMKLGLNVVKFFPSNVYGGLSAMKALSGGLITSARAAYAFMVPFSHVLPIWGIQRERELDEFLECDRLVPEMDQELKAVIEHDRAELAGEFCRGCGYCMPCPVGIEINNCARMSLMIRRSPSDAHLTGEAREKMKKIEDCLHCGQCSAKCPYGLDTPALLEKNYEDYREILAGKPL